MKRVPNNTDTIDLLFQQGVDLIKRRIYFGDIENSYEESPSKEFTHINIEVILRAIDKMLDFNNKPITILMNSYGGNIYDMLALVDKIQESPCKFIFYGKGIIASAATFIMAICDERYLSKNTRVLVHDAHTQIEETFTNIRIESDDCEKVKRILEDIYADNSHMPPEFWQEVTRRDLFLTAEETVKLGLADKVVGYLKRGNFRKGARQDTFDNIPTTRELTKLVNDLRRRIKLSPIKDLVITVKKEEIQDIKEYDNTEEELKLLNIVDKNEDKV